MEYRYKSMDGKEYITSELAIEADAKIIRRYCLPNRTRESLQNISYRPVELKIFKPSLAK